MARLSSLYVEQRHAIQSKSFFYIYFIIYKNSPFYTFKKTVSNIFTFNINKRIILKIDFRKKNKKRKLKKNIEYSKSFEKRKQTILEMKKNDFLRKTKVLLPVL